MSTSIKQKSEETYEEMVSSIAHLLPAQAPIEYFVHHNTLHIFEKYPFKEALQRAESLFGAHSLMAEEEYHKQKEEGRITEEDIHAALDLTPEDLQRIPTGFPLVKDEKMSRRLILQKMIRPLAASTARWFLLEQEELYTFPSGISGVEKHLQEQDFQHHVASLVGTDSDAELRFFLTGSKDKEVSLQRLHSHYDIRSFDLSSLQIHAKDRPTTFASIALWFQCLRIAEQYISEIPLQQMKGERHRDVLLAITEQDIDELVHPKLIRFYSCYLDQEAAYWAMPGRSSGILNSFVTLQDQSWSLSPIWVKEAVRFLRDQLQQEQTPEQILALVFSNLRVEKPQQEEYLRAVLLSLRGWSGMIHYLEKRPDMSLNEECQPKLIECAVLHLVVEWSAWKHLANDTVEMSDALPWLSIQAMMPHESRDLITETYRLFQYCAHGGVTAKALSLSTAEEQLLLATQIDQFSEFERCWTWQLAYERQHREEISRAVQQNAQIQLSQKEPLPPLYHLACCIDDREESLRRHIEEVDERCETIGVVGYFGLDMNYQGLRDAHPRPLCPPSIRPTHCVYEKPLNEEGALLQRAQSKGRRRWLGLLFWNGFVGSRTIVRGTLWTLFGGFFSIVAMILRIFSQRSAARFDNAFKEFIAPYPEEGTYIAIFQEENSDENPKTEDSDKNPKTEDSAIQQIGYTHDELVERSAQMLQFMTLTHSFSDLVLLMGHGSSSLNNPHEAAHDCGACGGGRGGPNARGLSKVLNDPEIRQSLREKHQIDIPKETQFLGCFHNTASGGIDFYDAHNLPSTHTELFARAEQNLREAQRRDSHERCRRFHSVETSVTPAQALHHAEGRAFDLSEPRPEYGHATNAICIVGRRSTTKGLFLDRRAFLISYDHTTDPEQEVLGPLLNSGGPVCAGINLEYFFSFVDNEFYGCGTKLPHNVTSLLGVMNGHMSDLRTGLPWQMVEIHEPVRLLTIVECTKDAMENVFERFPAFAELAIKRWIQLVLLDPETLSLLFLSEDGFVPISPSDQKLTEVPQSAAWYNGKRDHLSPVRVVSSLLQVGE